MLGIVYPPIEVHILGVGSSVLYIIFDTISGATYVWKNENIAAMIFKTTYMCSLLNPLHSILGSEMRVIANVKLWIPIPISL